MSKDDDIILKTAESHGGYVTVHECELLGIHKNNVFNLAKKNLLIRFAPGVYALPNTIPDELFILHLRFPSIVFSHETALYYLGYSDQVPFKYSVTLTAIPTAAPPYATISITLVEFSCMVNTFIVIFRKF